MADGIPHRDVEREEERQRVPGTAAPGKKYSQESRQEWGELEEGREEMSCDG